MSSSHQKLEGGGGGRSFENRVKKDISREKYLIFSLYNEKFGFSLSAVKEVIGLVEITKVPDVPSYFKGLVNLRGMIIPVIDLREKMNLPKAQYQEKKTSIVIAEVGQFVMGIIVDEVLAVADFSGEQMEKGDSIQAKIGRDYLIGIAKNENGQLTLLLDVEKTLGSADIIKIKQKVDLIEDAA